MSLWVRTPSYKFGNWELAFGNMETSILLIGDMYY